MREKLNRISNRVLYLNLLITQGMLLLIGFILYFFFLRHEWPIPVLFHTEHLGFALGVGSLFALIVILLDLLLMKVLPDHFFDDGGINERLFRDVNVFQIAWLALGVAFVEEWLFRGVLQNMIGLVWANLLFAALHYRYLKNVLYGLLIVVISLGFGSLYLWTDSLWSVIFAHFLVDFILGCMLRYRLLSFVK